MSKITYSLTIGDIECTVIDDGAPPIDFERLQGRFPHIPEAELRQAVQDAEQHPASIPWGINPLLVRAGDQVILVDGGNPRDEQPDTGLLADRLLDAGTSPGQINFVVITHLHGDHIGGLFTGPNMDFTYPNASYYVTHAEWNYWANTDLLKSMGDFGKTTYDRLRRLEPHIKKINTNTLIAPGVQAVSAMGHTPGHIGVMVQSKEQSLLHAVDTLHSPIQFAHPDWSIKFDAEKTLAAETRERLLGRAADEKLLTLFYHLPFPGLGHVRHDDGAFVWQPLPV